MGILTLFSGRGERLWSMQPDYIGQGSCFVTWPGGRPQLIWTNTSGPAQALYDGFGRRVRLLPALWKRWADRMRRNVASEVIRIGEDGTEYLTLTCDGKVHAFGPQT